MLRTLTFQKTTTVERTIRKRGGVTNTLPKADGWAKAKDPEGDFYFWNEFTRARTYDQMAIAALPEGWRITKDEATQIVYYYHRVTKETRNFHEPPEGAQAAYKSLMLGLAPVPKGPPPPASPSPASPPADAQSPTRRKTVAERISQSVVAERISQSVKLFRASL